MFRQIVRTHWQGGRLALLPLIVAAFALPLAAVQGTLDFGSSASLHDQMGGVLFALQTWLPFFPALAALTGITMALTVWAPDHAGKHVYALSLPVSRRRYVLMKLGSGALLAVVPAAMMGLGALIATASIAIPTGLEAYPGLLAVRFLGASIIAYALTFALSAWSGRSAVATVAAIAGVLLVAEFATTGLASTVAPAMADFSPIAWVFESAIKIPGPFGVFAGNWAMIDV